uniref:Uncharacterized protein n=1 Tax=Panagrolaimus superbus TaxID=310955 RepID=A0A914Z3D0_9BILA
MNPVVEKSEVILLSQLSELFSSFTGVDNSEVVEAASADEKSAAVVVEVDKDADVTAFVVGVCDESTGPNIVRR